MQNQLMTEALKEAHLAFEQGEIPIGAILVKDNQVIAKAHNTREQDPSPLNHAEIKVIQEVAKQKGDWRLNDFDLYVTTEPCPMCLGALFQARVGCLFVGCLDPKRESQNKGNIFPSLKSICNEHGYGELTSNNHMLKIQTGVLAEESAQILKDFFNQRRLQKP